MIKKKLIILIVFIVLVSGISAVCVLLIPGNDKKFIPNIIPTTEAYDKDYSYSTTIDSLEIYYLALNGKKTLDITFNTDDNYDNTISWKVENSDIVKMEDNIIHGMKNGTTKITGTLKNGFEKVYNIMVTDLIVPPKVDYKKEALPCKKYTKEQAELLDKILESRVKEGGIGTRGGVLAAARFITLEFPYVIKYFNENGRLVDNGIRPHVDGEGRYYHIGLYLDESKIDGLEKDKNGKIYKRQGPAIWGCKIYDEFVKRNRANGLTCSGFVSWAMLNGGFDVGDVGAGKAKGGYKTDLWNLGTHHEITLDYMKGNTYKVGDFIGRDGHAAIIIGFDDTTLYVAEELPRVSGTPNVDLNAYTYGRYDNKTKIKGHLYRGVTLHENLTYVIEMSDIYPNGDGWYTDMWEQ